ncbi:MULTISPECIES: diguanylate cyclase [unclassified Marinobacter]|uniref:sensor domain-containing diguanylate cyclase n=1 Tax=unclassified Marinobacter TaxID=83889 RepID=UPI0026E29D08|nr:MULTISPECIES: diguanylate cyclase [unclassified Marinobacter]MDO6443294.1 diguanylate cyclase [Marinobacter sp. 2_MG-2023]MDO6824308.1 diguanylate cyclase [Marinobacter sp. 1_MG-2023]
MTKQSDQGPSYTDAYSCFKKLSAGVPCVFFTYWLSADGKARRYPFVSEQVKSILGLDPGTLRENADAMFSMIHPEDMDGVAASIEKSAKTLTPWRCQARLKVFAGHYEWFETHAISERQADGSTVWYGQFYNIQHYKELEHTLREREAESAFQADFQKLIATLSTEFINLSFGTIDQCISELLQTIGSFFGVDRAYVYEFSSDYSVMNNTHEWCSPGVPSLIDSQRNVRTDDFDWWQAKINEMVSDNRVVFVGALEQLPDGPERSLLEQQGVCSMFCVPVRVRGLVTGFFGVDSLRKRTWREDQADLLIIVSGLLSGALERHRLESELLNQSIRDPLTTLHNRRYLMPRLNEMLSRASRYGEHFTLAMFDLDRFKHINDSGGHLAGDFCLRRFADILIEQTRETDVVARFGGEEFVVAFSSVSQADVRDTVSRIIRRVRDHDFVFEGRTLPLTVSAGIAAIGELGAIPASPDPLIRLADERVYCAKQAGRDCLVDASGVSRA